MLISVVHGIGIMFLMAGALSLLLPVRPLFIFWKSGKSQDLKHFEWVVMPVTTTLVMFGMFAGTALLRIGS